jgi:hypothetical protein
MAQIYRQIALLPNPKLLLWGLANVSACRTYNDSLRQEFDGSAGQHHPAVRSRSLPWPIVWLGFIVGGFHLVSLPVQLAISPIADGMTGPISVVLALVWILAAAVVLLIKPVWGTQPQPAVSAAVS